jgi:phosphoribosylformylglycinamidine (FGAM) synthase-like enzyme
LGLSDFEYDRILELMGRAPNLLELSLFSVMWSEHCGYKNSRPLLGRFPNEGNRVLQGPTTILLRWNLTRGRRRG